MYGPRCLFAFIQFSTRLTQQPRRAPSERACKALVVAQSTVTLLAAPWRHGGAVVVSRARLHSIHQALPRPACSWGMWQSIAACPLSPRRSWPRSIAGDPRAARCGTHFPGPRLTIPPGALASNAARAGRGAGGGRWTVWWQRAPTPLARRCAPKVGRAVCHCLGCVPRLGGHGRPLLAGEASRVGTARGPLPWPAAGRCGFPAWRRRTVRGARSCVKARAARSPAPLGPRLDTRSLRVGCAA